MNRSKKTQMQGYMQTQVKSFQSHQIEEGELLVAIHHHLLQMVTKRKIVSLVS